MIHIPQGNLKRVFQLCLDEPRIKTYEFLLPVNDAYLRRYLDLNYFY